MHRVKGAKMSTAKSSFEVSVENQGFASSGVKIWMAVFPAVSLTLFAVQPSAAAALCIVSGLAVSVAGLAHSSASDGENDGKFELKQRLIGIIAPAQFALLIWIAVYAGRSVAATLAGSSFAAFGFFAGLILLDFIGSLAILLAAERRDGISGLSVASLISGKYAGLFGKIF
jgi:hypothetical protein